MPSTILFPCPFLVLENVMFIFISSAASVQFGTHGVDHRDTGVFICANLNLCIQMINHAISLITGS